MTDLRALQTDFQAYLLGTPSTALGHVVDAGNLSATARLDVYAEAYRLRLLEALETDFVALCAYLGEDEFNALGNAYVTAHPSGHYSLRYFGQHMARFLATAQPYAENTLLTELAAFDWALTNAFDAPDEPVLMAADLGTVAPTDWPSLRFRAHTALARLDLRWNAPAIWKAADSEAEALPAAVQSPMPVAWVVWRQDLNTFFRSLDVDEAYALDTLLHGETFVAICEGLCEWIDPQNVAERAAGFLGQWVVDGMLREFTVDSG